MQLLQLKGGVAGTVSSLMNVNPDLFQQDTSKGFTEKVFKNDFPGAHFKAEKARMRKGQHDKPPNYCINKELKLC